MVRISRSPKTDEEIQDTIGGTFDGSLNYDDPNDAMQVDPGLQALVFAGL